DDSRDDERLPHASEAPPREGEEDDEEREVVEDEAVAELDPAAVLVEQAEAGDERDRRPQRPVPGAARPRPEAKEERRRGEPDGEAVAGDADERRARREFGEEGQRDGQVAPEVMQVEEAVALHLRLLAHREVAVTELGDLAEARVVVPGDDDADDRDRDRER